ncbi:T9SS type A sorting domain-containing protein [Hymenobacter lapidiphilus]|uniref:T9SS type A sorting domain-containing protein n=1 Tax=Hymenobacter lapidiphilus TaxID=2608003 RepID=A0A7Y7PSB8_9BACT|nr:T9SS type A sorting domain-containing protein [Hymenobacter lapidiphilus]NVO33131.1 T9SS type A sorting domain-containing protein [Hymenobacter lapidiphilus]
MKNTTPITRLICLFTLGCLGHLGAYAQAPAWQTALAVSSGGTSSVRATATDASGNVYVAGSFQGTIRIGPTTMTSYGLSDIFVAKWDKATGAFVWAQRGGGTAEEDVGGLAVNGANIYVTGYYYSSPIAFNGINLTKYPGNSPDIFVLKVSDAGNLSRTEWAQRAGGTNVDFATGVAVSGTSVYVVGSTASITATFGSVALPGSGADVFVTKLTDAGSSGSFVWAQRAGAAYGDGARAVAASGPNVYVVGGFEGPSITFGNTTLMGSGVDELAFKGFVTKLTDAGATGSFTWAKRCGNPGSATAVAVAVSGAAVYVGGTFTKAATTFGTTVLTNAGSAATTDVFVTKLVDAGNDASFGWAQRLGGVNDDRIGGIAVRGAEVYTTGSFSGSVSVGSTSLNSVGRTNSFVAKLADGGATSNFVWAQQAGGPGSAISQGIALADASVWVGGETVPPASFGTQLITSPTTNTLGFIALLTDPRLPLATANAGLAVGLRLWPNPAQAAVNVLLPALAGGSPATLTLLDGLGRVVQTIRVLPVAAGGPQVLNLTGLMPGLYHLRIQAGGQQVSRALAVE